nr:hypothetical protein [Photorhabdus sp. CRI-LC]
MHDMAPAVATPPVHRATPAISGQRVANRDCRWSVSAMVATATDFLAVVVPQHHLGGHGRDSDATGSVSRFGAVQLVFHPVVARCHRVLDALFVHRSRRRQRFAVRLIRLTGTLSPCYFGRSYLRISGTWRTALAQRAAARNAGNG